MHVLFRQQGYKFYFFNYEGGEPMHVHVDREEASAKFWIHPIAKASSNGFLHEELLEIESIVNEKQLTIHNRWREFFG